MTVEAASALVCHEDNGPRHGLRWSEGKLARKREVTDTETNLAMSQPPNLLDLNTNNMSKTKRNSEGE